jgi:NADPH-dependent ferric siderophore reductase
MSGPMTPQLPPMLGRATREQATADLASALAADGVILIAPDGAIPLLARLLGDLEGELHHWVAWIEHPGTEDLLMVNRAAPVGADGPEGQVAFVAMQRADVEQLLAYASVKGLDPGERYRMFVSEVDVDLGERPALPQLFLDALERFEAAG